MDVLLFRSRAWLCALRVEDVFETFRPLPVEPVMGAPGFVRGAAIVRGAPTPVVDLAVLLGADDAAQPQSLQDARGLHSAAQSLQEAARGLQEAARGRRFVAVRAGGHRVVLEVDEVLGIRPLSVAELTAAPPLLGGAVREHVEALGMLDGQLLAVLDAGRLLPYSSLLPASPGPEAS
jgi:purine-binding chemotaxis protein CheW